MVAYDDIRKPEAVLRHNLSFRGLLLPKPPSRAYLSYTGINRHTADTRIGMVDSTVAVEAMEGGESC